MLNLSNRPNGQNTKSWCLSFFLATSLQCIGIDGTQIATYLEKLQRWILLITLAKVLLKWLTGMLRRWNSNKKKGAENYTKEKMFSLWLYYSGRSSGFNKHSIALNSFRFSFHCSLEHLCLGRFSPPQVWLYIYKEFWMLDIFCSGLALCSPEKKFISLCDFCLSVISVFTSMKLAESPRTKANHLVSSCLLLLFLFPWLPAIRAPSSLKHHLGGSELQNSVRATFPGKASCWAWSTV